mmetsp:Transcript_19151/g.64150  ORF Transcript_19151/g.64150 Transcript_19151/m.64150 type:complete len:300 (-) Transcript_19151:99-998(-)
MQLVVKCAQHGNATLDPVLLRLVRWQQDKQHEVGGVARGGERAFSRRCAIHRRIVDALRRHRARGGLEPDHGHLCVQDLWLRLPKDTLVRVPAAAIEVQPVDQAAFCGRLGRGVHPHVAQDFEVEVDLVDGDPVLARVVLSRAGDEGLREEEARDPEDGRLPVVHPALEESDALREVAHPAAQRLARRICLLGPEVRHLIIEDRVEDRLELCRHYNQALDSLLDVGEAGSDHDQELVEARELLDEDRVHGLEVIRGVFVHDLVDRPRPRNLPLDLARHGGDDLLRRRPAPAAGAGLQGE